jgi:hypothetical protein
VATVTFTEDALAILRSRYPAFEFWLVKLTGRGYLWCCRRDDVSVSAESPEALVALLAELSTQP